MRTPQVCIARDQIQEVVQDLRKDMSRRESLGIEDIIDSGHTAGLLLPYLVVRAPVSMRVRTLSNEALRCDDSSHCWTTYTT